MVWQTARSLSGDPDRSRAGRCGTRRVHARDDGDPDAVRANRRAAAAGLLPGVLAAARRARADGRHVDPGDSHGGRDLDPVARRDRDRRRRLRPGRARVEVERRRAGDPDPRRRRDPPVAAHAERARCFLALGRAGTFLGYTLLWAAATLAAIVVGVQGDIVRWPRAMPSPPYSSSRCSAYLTTRALGIPLWRYVRSLSGVVQATALMADRRARSARSARGGRGSRARHVSCCSWSSAAPSTRCVPLARARRDGGDRRRDSAPEA